jgi:hypothetical protein
MAQINKKKILQVYLFYRLAIMVVTVALVSQFTTLGDSRIYLEAGMHDTFAIAGWKAVLDNTLLPKVLVFSVRKVLLGSAFLTHLFFSLLAFYGVKKLVEAVDTADETRFRIFIFLLFFPSFNIWSSIAGKEAIIVFSIGILASRIVRFFQGEKFRFDFLALLALYLVMVIKIQYAVAVVQLVLYVILIRRLKIRGTMEVLLILAIVAINIAALYIARDYIDEYSRMLIYYFRAQARSTRESPFVHPYDFFRLLPYGMFISLWGPRVDEIGISILHMFTFFESLLMFILLAFFLKKTVYLLLIRMKLHFRRLFLLLNTMFWLLLAQYTQGILNPGSAVRYRTNFYLLMIALLYSLYIAQQDSTGESPAPISPQMEGASL